MATPEEKEDVVLEVGVKGGGRARGSVSGDTIHSVRFNDLDEETRNAIADAMRVQNPEAAQKIRASDPKKDWKSRMKRAARYQPSVVDFAIAGGVVVSVTLVWEGVRYLLRNKFPNMPGFIRRGETRTTTTRTPRIAAVASA